MERVWNKFHTLFGPDLKVGFETTFTKEVVLNLNMLYWKSGLIHNSPSETVKRVYEPAVKVLGSCKDGEAVQVFFEPVSPVEALFRRLVFFRKAYPQKPRPWVVAARHGEVEHFGFDSWNSKDQKYLSLAYPGVSGEFAPVYVKIQDGKEDGFVYLEVWAWSEDGKVVVQGRRVGKSETPESLHLAQPGGLVYSV
ncbi:MAG: hypothetical protein NTV77_02610 [Candidatus Azambacteria bacterium]|nr:hypothetical protein [Candidatus Azambacteria bacterium]